ncbi:MAG: ABC transporter substrate-binding protein, partial [Spirochaetes bacterium]|nr:ABC transporter substrate-binding protein [Spirochaetota bacterium]
MKNRQLNLAAISLAFLALFAAFGAFALIATACAPPGGAGTPGELRFGFTTEPSTLDPLSLANTADGRRILFNVFEGLVTPDTQGRMQPALASSWTVEEEGRVFDFTIREGVRFHDGSLLTAADVKFSLETARDVGFVGFDNIESIEIPQENRLRLTLANPYPDFLPYLTVGIVRAGSTDRETNAVGTGPFFIENYRVQHSLELRRFDDYWQRHLPTPRNIPNLERVTIVFLANSDALLLGLLAGSIDGASLTGALASQLNRQNFDIFENRSATVQLLALNNTTPPLDDIRVRQAINYSIDLQEIIDAAFFGMGEPSGSPVIPGLAAYHDPALTDTFPFNPQRAASLLAEAGFGEGGGR